jgi:putative endonuclease
VTNDLVRRIYEHKQGLVPGFTKQYNVKTLVYYETTENITAAIEREKCLKRWKREWKIELFKKDNPSWQDLSTSL